MKKHLIITFNLILIFLLFSGCYPSGPLKTEKAKLGPLTSSTRDLVLLPAPKEKIYCAVYKFRDQTGQYKNLAGGASWSTAVTQGATSILTKSLEESGWFIPIEREGLSNLLNERKIIRSSRENYQTEGGNNLPDLPPLLYAGVLLEGGIISYETNIHTGGIGAKYFGAGGSGQYRQDQVTIYLRAISTQNGRVLKTVYTTKTILSQAVDVGVFRFVDLKKLLEVEMGYSYNEPPQLCVTAAIEKAVQSLIIEGVFDGIWALNNQEEINHPIIKSYIKEKQELKNNDLMLGGFSDYPKTGLGISAGGNFLRIDYGNPVTNPSMEGNIHYVASPSLSFNLSVGSSVFETDRFFKSNAVLATITGNYYLQNDPYFRPFLSFGGTYIFRGANSTRYAKNDKKRGLFGITSGVGIRYYFNSSLGINLQLQNIYLLSDELDEIKNGKLNDYLWILKTGFNYYF
jgi:curli production assembly/transport component CsgG